ncbi:hypothetical protein [Mucilaginibacter oryzae]
MTVSFIGLLLIVNRLHWIQWTGMVTWLSITVLLFEFGHVLANF